MEVIKISLLSTYGNKTKSFNIRVKVRFPLYLKYIIQNSTTKILSYFFWNYNYIKKFKTMIYWPRIYFWYIEFYFRRLLNYNEYESIYRVRMAYELQSSHQLMSWKFPQYSYNEACNINKNGQMLEALNSHCTQSICDITA